MNDAREVQVLRDMPLGTHGRTGRLVMLNKDERDRHRFVFYRGTTNPARDAVARCTVDGLRALHERRQDVERHAGQHPDMLAAIALALDLPLVDTEPRRIAAYLEAFPAP